MQILPKKTRKFPLNIVGIFLKKKDAKLEFQMIQHAKDGATIDRMNEAIQGDIQDMPMYVFYKALEIVR